MNRVRFVALVATLAGFAVTGCGRQKPAAAPDSGLPHDATVDVSADRGAGADISDAGPPVSDTKAESKEAGGDGAEAGSDLVPETAHETAPEAAQDVVPDAVPETAQDTAPDGSPADAEAGTDGEASVDGETGAGATNCARFCAKVLALACVKDEPSMCLSKCEQLSTMPSCGPEYAQLVACGADQAASDFHCDEGIGELVESVCVAQQQAFGLCAVMP